MSALSQALRDPFPLPPNRLARFYRGSGALDTFRGTSTPYADQGPEDWVGSATRAWTRSDDRLSAGGASIVELGGENLSLDDVLRREPEALAGAALVRRAGPSLGVLVKLLDAGERLPVHCHPRREDAAALLGSRFGKTEAWLILGTSDPAGGVVWAGFASAVGRSQLRRWIDEQDTSALLGSLVEHRVVVGDVFLIPGGTPHAIDRGVFLLELQEPTDYSVVAETRGFPIDPADASLGLGWDRAIDFFDRQPADGVRQERRKTSAGAASLLNDEADPYFRALLMRIDGTAALPFEPTYAVGVILDGIGSIEGSTRRLGLRRGVSFAVPAAAVPHTRVVDGRGLELVWCLGPDPAALDRQPLPDIVAIG